MHAAVGDLASPGTGITQPLLTMGTPQGTCCIQLSRRKKCLTCRRSHDSERQALRREKLKPQIKATRSNVAKKRSIYAHVLCDLCKDKSTTKYCNECIPKYKQMSYIKSSCEKRRKLALENQPGSVNKAIINTNSQSTDDYSKKKSMYSHLLCNACIEKPKKKVLHM